MKNEALNRKQKMSRTQSTEQQLFAPTILTIHKIASNKTKTKKTKSTKHKKKNKKQRKEKQFASMKIESACCAYVNYMPDMCTVILHCTHCNSNEKKTHFTVVNSCRYVPKKWNPFSC